MAAVEDGIQMLTGAMDLRKDYDAMAYMNLLYRESAKGFQTGCMTPQGK